MPNDIANSIILVGNPNVGKSVLFHRLTGAYVNVSNYPGTTVEITQSATKFDANTNLIDSPGVLSLPSRTDDERATMKALLNEKIRCIIQVGDAKNVRRTLNLTALLTELKLPMMLVLNMQDEAIARGLMVNTDELAKELNIPVIPAVATSGEGIDAVISHISQVKIPDPILHYDVVSEEIITKMSEFIQQNCPHKFLASRGLAILFLGKDSEVEEWIASQLGNKFPEILALRDFLQQKLNENYANLSDVKGFDFQENQTAKNTQNIQNIQNIQNSNINSNINSNLNSKENNLLLSALFARERSLAADTLSKTIISRSLNSSPLLSQKIGQYVVHPFWGFPILLAVLYAVYQFVGVFGATTLVGLLEEDLFGEILNPAFTTFFENLNSKTLNIAWLNDLIVGEYGLWTMGMTYALALILPIVSTFFIAFGILEDSGYLPRLSVIANRIFAMIGLNGRAVLPMILGLGCVTMATLTTRILSTPRERLIAIFLLSLAIPCSAQLGVVLGMLGSYSLKAVIIWTLCMVGVLLLTGFLASKLIKGRRIPLVTELPPMRLPVLANVLKKTGGRLKWYLLEVIPLFLLGTLLMFVLDKLGVLPAIIEFGEPLVTGFLGLPKEASAAFVMGFLRRDFGATGLFTMAENLSEIQALVGMVTLTLFIPCFASFVMIIKEKGVKVSLLMLIMIIPFAFLVGGVLNQILRIVY